MRGHIIEPPIVPMPPSEYEITVCERELTLLRSCVIRTLDFNMNKHLSLEVIEGDMRSKHITSLNKDLQRLADDLRDLQENDQFNVGFEWIVICLDEGVILRYGSQID